MQSARRRDPHPAAGEPWFLRGEWVAEVNDDQQAALHPQTSERRIWTVAISLLAYTEEQAFHYVVECRFVVSNDQCLDL